MTRLALLLLLPALAACTAPANQSPTAAAVSEIVYTRVMEAVPQYRLHSRQKALAICVQWPTGEEDPIYIDTLGAYALADQSDGKFTPGEIVQGAIRDCQGRQAEGQFDCKCQIMDVAGSNKLVVPETVKSTIHPIQSRKSKAERSEAPATDADRDS